MKTLTSSAPRLQAAKQATIEDIRAVAESLAKSLEDDKAEDLLFIDLQGKSSLADFMIIASGRSGRHVAALADHISQEAKKLTGRPASVEGMPNADWVLPSWPCCACGLNLMPRSFPDYRTPGLQAGTGGRSHPLYRSGPSLHSACLRRSPGDR